MTLERLLISVIFLCVLVIVATAKNASGRDFKESEEQAIHVCILVAVVAGVLLATTIASHRKPTDVPRVISGSVVTTT